MTVASGTLGTPSLSATGSPASRDLALWVAACSGGELLGLGVAFAGMALLFALYGEPTSTVSRVLLVVDSMILGAAEGAITGSLQGLVLRRRLPALRVPAFATATAVVAALGWALGMSIPTFVLSDQATSASAAATDPPLALLVATTVALGAVLGAVFGLGQWVVLRRHAANAGLWVVGNAAAWGIALVPTYVIPALIDDDAPRWVWIVSGVPAGVLAGLLLGVITGVVFVRLRPR